MYPDIKTRFRVAGHNAMCYLLLGGACAAIGFTSEPSCFHGLFVILGISGGIAAIGSFFYRLISGDIT